MPRDVDALLLAAGLVTLAGVVVYLAGAGLIWFGPVALIVAGLLAVATAFRGLATTTAPDQDHE